MMDSRLVRTAVAAVLVASLCVPATAMAAKPANKPPKGPKGGPGVTAQGKPDKPLGQQKAEEKKTAKQEKQAAALKARIARILRQRKAKFDRAEAIIQRRIDRLSAIASRAETLGVDVTEAKAALETAKTELENAAAEEEAAVEAFKAVLDAADRKAAFAEARAQARVATKALQRARLAVVNALKLLHKAVDESAVWSKNASGTVEPKAPDDEGTEETTP